MIGTDQEVLVADFEGNDRASGRTPDFRLTHFAIDPNNSPRVGDAVKTKITSATANFILADELPIEVRRTKGGHTTEARSKEIKKGPLMVGMPSLATLKAKM
mgnify:FL=1